MAVSIFKKLFGARNPTPNEVRIIALDEYGMGGDSFTGLSDVNNVEELTEVRAKAKLPVWYSQSPYGTPRFDDIQQFRNLAQMGVVQRCINLKNEQIFNTKWNIVPVDPTDATPATQKIADGVKDFMAEVNPENKKSLFEETIRAYVDKWEIGEGVLIKMFRTGDYEKVAGQNVMLMGAKGKLTKIQAFDASQFYIWQTLHGELIGYWQFNFIGTPPRFFAPREIIILADQEVTYRPYARSRIRAVQDFLETVAAWSLQLKNFYKKGAILQGIVKTAGLNKKEQDRLEKFFTDKFKTMEHKLALVQGLSQDTTIEFMPLMLSVKDLAFLEGFEFIQDFIMSEFGIIRTELYGSAGDAKAGAAESSRINRKRIRADLNEIEEVYNTEIIAELDSTGKVKFEFEKETDPEVIKVKQETAASQLMSGQITLNEWRKEAGKQTYTDERANIPTPFLMMDQAEKEAEQATKTAEMQMDGQKQIAGMREADTKVGDENEPSVVNNSGNREGQSLSINIKKSMEAYGDLLKTLDASDVGALTPELKKK